MSEQYTRNAPVYTAEQFQTAVTPWPDGVDECGEVDGPHLHGADLLSVADGDWIVTSENGGRAVIDDATFRAHFTLKA